MSNSATELSREDILRQTVRRYLADKAYRYILGKSQTAKLRQIVKGVDIEGATMRLVRDVMAEDDRFECVDRRWSTSARFGDSHRPFERVVAGILQSAGVPLDLDSLAGELAGVYGRSVDFYQQALPRVLANKDKYFEVTEGTYGLTSWLIIATSDDEADVVFDNYLSENQVDEFTALCPAADWTLDNLAETAASMVVECKEPVPVKILALFAWRALGEDFDPVEFYGALLNNARILLLSDQKAYSSDAEGQFKTALKSMADELAELPMEEEEEAEGPVTVTETDKEEIINMILERGSASSEELLENILEVSPGESAFAGALESLNEVLREDERVMWLGGGRWSKVVVFPDEVKKIPDSLAVPAVPVFETPEGDVYDQELEIDGFEGELKTAIYDSLTEDVTDEDPALTDYQPNGNSQKCVLKYHHKTEGTFPLCQISPDFFGTTPEIIPVVLIDEGKRKNVFVNNTTRLIYGMKDFYKDITEVSGAVFYIEQTEKPGEYRFKFDGEVDSQLGVDIDRSLELLDLKARYESQAMPIFDVIVEILDHHKKGMTFAQLVNEVNIVKRCSRLLVASILSSYHAFYTRGKSGLWQYDEKKRSQGFNKTKRKYVKKG